jgi:hypothetical protein
MKHFIRIANAAKQLRPHAKSIVTTSLWSYLMVVSVQVEGGTFDYEAKMVRVAVAGLLAVRLLYLKKNVLWLYGMVKVTLAIIGLWRTFAGFTDNATANAVLFLVAIFTMTSGLEDCAKGLAEADAEIPGVRIRPV